VTVLFSVMVKGSISLTLLLHIVSSRLVLKRLKSLRQDS
jgi:hypothetical protein